MKTLNTILIIAATSAGFTLTAAEPFLSPRAYDNIPRVIASTGEKNPNLLAGPRVGKATKDVKPVIVATDYKNPDLLVANKCAMAPRAKDNTPACAKHCEIAEVK